MTTLLIAEHEGATLKDSTNKALTAAAQLGAEVHVLVAGGGAGTKAAAEAAAEAAGLAAGAVVAPLLQALTARMAATANTAASFR